MRWRAGVVAICALAGCDWHGTQDHNRGEPAVDLPQSPPLESWVSMASSAAGRAAAPDPAAPLTSERMERYLRYRRDLVANYDLHREAHATAERALEFRPRAEELARWDADITEDEVIQIEAVATPVLLKRAYARGFDVAAAEAEIAGWSQERRAPAARHLAEVRRSQLAASKLAEERARYGDASVNAVLAREEELARLSETFFRATAPRPRRR